MISSRLTDAMERKIRGFAILEDAGLHISDNKSDGDWLIQVSGYYADVDDKGNPVTRYRKSNVCRVKNPAASYVRRNTYTGLMETWPQPEKEEERDQIWEIFQARYKEAKRTWENERAKYPAIFTEG